MGSSPETDNGWLISSLDIFLPCIAYIVALCLKMGIQIRENVAALAQKRGAMLQIVYYTGYNTQAKSQAQYSSQHAPASCVALACAEESLSGRHLQLLVSIWVCLWWVLARSQHYTSHVCGSWVICTRSRWQPSFTFAGMSWPSEPDRQEVCGNDGEVREEKFS